MTTATLAPAAPAVAPAVLDLDARLAAVDAQMTVRLQDADARLSVNAAQPETIVNLADMVTAPAPAPAPVDLYPTPVAALLHRAQQRIRSGWCKGHSVDGQGAVCAVEAIRIESRRNVNLQGAAETLVLDHIRAEFGDWETIPSWNDAQTNPAPVIRILGQAANTAANRGH